MDRNEFFKALFQAVLCFAISVSIALVILGLSSCKTQYTPVDVHDRDSVRVEQRVDTFIQVITDSVTIQMPCSDSIEVAYVDRYHTNTVYRKVEVHDTIAVNNNDTIYQAVEVPVEVKYVPGYYHFTSWAFWLLLAAVVLVIGIKFLVKR